MSRMYVEKKIDRSIDRDNVRDIDDRVDGSEAVKSSEIGNIEERTMTCMRNRALCVAMFESLPTNSRDYTSLLSSSIDI